MAIASTQTICPAEQPEIKITVSIQADGYFLSLFIFVKSI